MRPYTSHSLLQRYEWLSMKSGELVTKATIKEVDSPGYPSPKQIEMLNKRIDNLRLMIYNKMR